MPPNRLPYFRFDVLAYLTDPAVLAMDADAEGCYIRLLARMWQTPTPGRVLDALVYEMSGLARLSEQYRVLYRTEGWEPPEHYGGPVSCEEIARGRVEEVTGQLEAAFDTMSEPGAWLQKRMLSEWRRCCNDTKARENGARVTNEKRWGKVAQRSLSGRSAVGNREVDVEESKTTPTASGGVVVSKNGKNPDHIPIPEWLEPAVWADWCTYRRACKRPWTKKAALLTVSKLTELRSQGHDPRAVVENSILNGWIGPYPPRADAKPKPIAEDW